MWQQSGTFRGKKKTSIRAILTTADDDEEAAELWEPRRGMRLVINGTPKRSGMCVRGSHFHSADLFSGSSVHC